MATDNVSRRYQIGTKMFYFITISGLMSYNASSKNILPVFTKRMTLAYATLCKITGSWREDETYKADPRWRT
jgi:hypothetical protein